MNYPIVLTIAGSDSSGGAGIQADIKTISSLGVYAASAITALTAQNTTGVYGIQPTTPDILRAQIMAVLTDLEPHAIKIGMIGSLENARIIVDCLKGYRKVPIICDPVMVSTSGSQLMDPEAINFLKSDLFPICSLLTPNLHETSKLLQLEGLPNNVTQMKDCAIRLLRYGSFAVLIKGGHLEGNRMVDLLLTCTGEELQIEQERVETSNLHGTGCTLSSAIAAYMARGLALKDAIRKAKIYIGQAIIAGAEVKIGKGHGPVNHFFAPETMKILY